MGGTGGWGSGRDKWVGQVGGTVGGTLGQQIKGQVDSWGGTQTNIKSEPFKGVILHNAPTGQLYLHSQLYKIHGLYTLTQMNTMFQVCLQDKRTHTFKPFIRNAGDTGPHLTVKCCEEEGSNRGLAREEGEAEVCSTACVGGDTMVS